MKFRLRTTNALVFSLLLTACSSLVVRHVPERTTPSEGGGVLYALSKPVWIVNVKGARDGTPVPPNKQVFEVSSKPVFVPDYQQLYEVKLSPGIFTSDSIKVAVAEDGTLRNVVSTSEPQLTETLKVIASLVATATIFGITPGVEEPEYPEEKKRDKKERDRLAALEDQLQAALKKKADEVAEKPTKDAIDALRSIKQELEAVSAARAELDHRISADAYTTGTMVSEIVHLTPVFCAATQAWPDPAEILARYNALSDDQKADPRNRLFVVVRPAGSTGTAPDCISK